jgi:hypothetical protein
MRSTREKLQRLPMHVTMLQEDCNRYAIVGLFYFRQLFFVKFDLKLHPIKVRSGPVSLLTERLVPGDRTEAADYIKLLMIYASGSRS